MKTISIYRHTDGTARWIVWKSEEPTKEEVSPKGAVYIAYPRMTTEFCDFVENATKEKVNELLDKYIWK